MKQFIIYGAGKRGKWCLDFLKWRKMEDRVYAFCYKNYESLDKVDGKEVLSYETVREKGLPVLISLENTLEVQRLSSLMLNDGIEVFTRENFYKLLNEDQVVFLREWCAYHHAKNNDQCFSDAEDPNEIVIFWDKNSVFYHLFQQLDLTNMIELACGHGRHVPYYQDFAGTITLVDILEENMVICRDRFKETENIIYYKNNGFNLEELPSDQYTALFTYDSMVHFEMMDVYSYLKDIYRVLEVGGKALFHHSNYNKDYKADFSHELHARCFMDKDVFAHLAYRVGFKILEQKVIDWHGVKELDCITLVEK